jgi:preprotein translocase subunit SecG
MHTIVIIVHMFVCIGLIGLVLIQHGKGADAGAAFGSGASSTVFGSRGSASFLTRTTAILATVFFVTSLTLGYFSGHKEPKSVVEEIKPTTEMEVTTELPVDNTKQESSELPPDSATPPIKEETPVVNDAPTTTTDDSTQEEVPAPSDTGEPAPQESE